MTPFALVTGGAGFIGTHLAETLLKEGYRVWIVDDFSQCAEQPSSRLKAHFGEDKVIISQTDYTKPIFFQQLTAHQHELTHLFHLASPVGVPIVMNTPPHRFEQHKIASIHLFDWAFARGMTVFFASSSEVYGNLRTNKPLNENDALPISWFETQQGRFLYAKLKRELELYLINLYQSEPNNCLIGRFFNVFGEGQREENGMVIPTFVRRITLKQPVPLYENGCSIRSFIPVSLAVKAILTLMQQPVREQLIVNIGCDKPVDIRTLACEIHQLIHPDSPPSFDFLQNESGRNQAIHTRIPDISTLKRLSADTSFPEELEQTDWKTYLRQWIVPELRSSN